MTADGADGGGHGWAGRGDEPWPGSSPHLPGSDEMIALGLAVPVYLPMVVEESPDPDAPEGPPIFEGEFAAPAHLRDSDGTVGTGVLATLVDLIGGLANGIGVLPDWVVTTNVALRRVAPRQPITPDGPLTLRARLLRRGQFSAVGSVSVRRADGGQVAEGTVTCAVLVPEGGPPSFPRPFRRRPFALPADPLFRSTPEEFFALSSGPGPCEVRAQAPPHVRNPWTIVHGGALAVLTDAAARKTLAHPTGIDAEPDQLVVTDLVLHFVSPGRVGPSIGRGELIGSRGDEHLVRVAVRDHGAADRPIALAVATVRPR